MDYDAWLTKDLDARFDDDGEPTEECFADEADQEIRAGLDNSDLSDDLVVELFGYLSLELTHAEQISIMREALAHKNEALERAIRKVSSVEGLRRFEAHEAEAEREAERNKEEYERDCYEMRNA